MENLVRETDLNLWGCLGDCLIFVPISLSLSNLVAYKKTCNLVKRVVFCYPRNAAREFPLVSNRIKLTAQMECKIITIIIMIISHVYEAADKSSFSFQAKCVIFS